MNFNNSLLFLSILITLISFAWIFRLKQTKDKFFFLLIVIFIYMYGGLGACLTEANRTYLNYYLMYIVVLGATIKFSNFGVGFTKVDDLKFSSYLEKHAKAILILYFVVSLLTLIFPEIIIYRLFSPPSPDVYANLDRKFADEGRDVFTSIILLTRTFLVPFFYWALYKYRDNIITIILLIFFNLYISYCHDEYIGRHQILVALLIISLFYYGRLSRKEKIAFIAVAIAAIPFLAYGFYQYSSIRHGEGTEDVSTGLAMELLWGQEITYPLLFDSYKNYYDPVLIWNYFEWMIFLPLPGFLKFGFGSFPSYRFTEVVTGLSAGERGFSIVLPGVIGESYFFFGPILFFLHAVILGLLIKAVYKSFRSAPSLIFVFFFYAVTLSFQLSRGGTLSVYPLIFKHYLIITLFLSYLRKSKKYVRIA